MGEGPRAGTVGNLGVVLLGSAEPETSHKTGLGLGRFRLGLPLDYLPLRGPT